MLDGRGRSALTRNLNTSGRRAGAALGTATIWLLVVVLLAGLGGAARAAERRYYFDAHDSGAGLAQHSVTAILQDRTGYVWIATHGGLHRYDGYSYQLFQHDAADPASLPDSYVTALAEDAHGRIWLGSDKAGIAYLDPGNRQVVVPELPRAAPARALRNDIGALAFAAPSTLWIGNAAGIERIDTESGERRVVFSFADAAPAGRQVQRLLASADGTLWAATSLGVLRLDPAGEAPAPVGAGIIGNARALALAADGSVYVGTTQGLYRIGVDRERIEQVWPADADVARRNVQVLAQDDQGRLWLGVERAGLVVYDPATRGSESLVRSPDMPASLPENTITALFVDRAGLLWVGGAAHGLSSVDPRGARFDYVADLDSEAAAQSGNNIRALFEDSATLIWVGTYNSGLKRYDRISGRFEGFNAPLLQAAPAALPPRINALAGGADGSLWIASDAGVYQLDAARRTPRLLPLRGPAADGLPSQHISALLAARDGSLWFGSSDAGLAHWWPGADRWEYFRGDASDPRGIAHDAVLTLSEDRGGRIWIGTLGGLSVRDGNTTRSYHAVPGDPHSLSDETVTAIHQAANGTIWIGTRSGLNRFDADSSGGHFSRYLMHDGLAADTVFGILEDAEGLLWISTNRGISAFDRARKSFHNFSLKDGLQGLEFNAGAAAALSDGHLAFGGSDGINLFDPAGIRFSRYAAPVVITGIQVDGRPVAPPQPGTDLQIAQGARVLRVEFAALDYAAPEHNEYSYRLRGFDDAWNSAGTRHEVTYTNLPPGRYQLELRGSNHDGTWNEQTTSIGLLIRPPWWAAPPMLAAYALIALLIGLLARREYVRKRAEEKAHHHAIAERENRLRLALWGSGDEFWDWDLARDEIVITGVGDLLRRAQDHRTLPAHAWIGDNVHEDDRAVVAERLGDHLHGLRAQFESEHRMRAADQQWLWVFVRGKIVERDEAGKPLRLSGTVRDVTASRAAERERRISAEVIDSMAEAVCVTDLEFRFVSANRAFTRMTGYEQAAIAGQSAALLNCGKHPPEYYRAMRDAFTRDGHWSGELWQRRRDGEEFLCWLEISVVHDAVGERTHYVGVMSDITDRKRAEQELRYLANYDTMTGLPNRALLSERLGQAILRGRHSGHRVAVLFLDLDRFKHVNDSMGHATGDRMLRAAGARLRACIASNDTVGRLGGDEFTVVLENLAEAREAESVAQKLLEAFAVPLHLDTGEDVVISPSIGISIFPDHGQVPSELLKFADTAMYQAKERGRNTYMVYTADMDAAARSRATLIAALRRGLERNEFNVVYQPKLSLLDNRVTGVEALLRWTTEDFGNVPPTTFIPLAEETGLIVPIGEFVLNAACAQLRRWHDQGFTSLRIAVNLSMLQLLRGELAVRLHQILETHGLAAGRLELELTESMVMANAEQSVRTLTELKTIGVSLAIDDFGTGYSSLSYLKRLPIDTLKIDQAFVGDITTDPDDAAITATIITMAHSLDLNVVAEGVESAEQLQYLRSQGCDEIQGHWFARPLEADACYTFMTMFESNRTGKIVA
jgi:diguanylate cyclase (GGDEF)-like protein/PAS domain S-box-containing protein